MSSGIRPGKVLIIGPGPVNIGHGSELDFAAAQSAMTFSELGFHVTAVDSNPAGLLSEKAQTLFAPVDMASIKQAIESGKPDYIFPSAGGAAALALMLGISAKGVTNGTQILGIDVDAIKTVTDRMLLKKKLSGLGIEMPKSSLTLSVEEAERYASAVGYPVVVRPAIAGAGRMSFVYNVEDLRLVAGGILSASSPVLVEESLTGWEKLETEVLSDCTGSAATIAFRENLDPMGIHSGDAVAVIPMQTVTEGIRNSMDEISSSIVTALAIHGTANIQFGYHAASGRLLVLEINPRYSRSSAFAATATGVNVAMAMARCAAGMTLAEQDLVSRPHVLPVTVRIPVFQFEKYDGADSRLNTRMQSVGAVAGIGASFGEAARNALNALGEDCGKKYRNLDAAGLLSKISEPSGDRPGVIRIALEKGIDPVAVSNASGIKPWFIEQLRNPKTGGESRQTGEIKSSRSGPVLILGSGPSRIGESQELAAMGAQLADAFRLSGIEAIIADSNPYGTASIPSDSTRTILSPLDLDSITGICSEYSPRGIVCQTGGFHAQSLAALLEQLGLMTLGTSVRTAAEAESREGLALIASETGIRIPEAARAKNREEAFDAAARIGFPVIILPETETPDGRCNRIVNDEDMLAEHLQTAIFPVFVEKFLEGGFMVQADAVCDGSEVLIPALVQHVEHAGIHTGDAACVVPPLNISGDQEKEIRNICLRIASHLGATGFMNAQFAILKETIYCLGISLRASRTVPLVSRVTGIPMVGLAAKTMLGMKIQDMGIAIPELQHYGVREAVFPFDVFSGVDPLLGPEMRSTGQSLGTGRNFGLAFARALQAAGAGLPDRGKILVTVSRSDRPELLKLAERLIKLGFDISATRGTARFLNENSIDAKTVLKVYEGRPNIVDDIKNGAYSLIINTPSGKLSRYDDSYIRKAAITYGVPYVTTLAGARAAVSGIEALREMSGL